MTKRLRNSSSIAAHIHTLSIEALERFVLSLDRNTLQKHYLNHLYTLSLKRHSGLSIPRMITIRIANYTYGHDPGSVHTRMVPRILHCLMWARAQVGNPWYGMPVDIIRYCIKPKLYQGPLYFLYDDIVSNESDRFIIL